MRLISVLFVLTVALAVISAADSPSLTGEWKLHSSIQGYENDLACTLTQKDQELTGTCKHDQTELAVTGRLDEKKVTFQYKTTYEGQELTIVHSGTLDGPARIAGIVEVQPMGVSGDFTATQSK